MIQHTSHTTGERRIVFFDARNSDAQPRAEKPDTADREAPQTVRLIDAIQTLLDVQFGPKTLRERIQESLEETQVSAEQRLQWLVKGLTRVLAFYDEMGAGTAIALDGQQRTFTRVPGTPDISPEERRLITEMRQRLTGPEAMVTLAREAGVPVSDAAIRYLEQRRAAAGIAARLADFDRLSAALPNDVAELTGKGSAEIQGALQALRTIQPVVAELDREQDTVHALPGDLAQREAIQRYRQFFDDGGGSAWAQYTDGNIRYLERELSLAQRRERLRDLRDQFKQLTTPIGDQYARRAELNTEQVIALQQQCNTLRASMPALETQLSEESVRARNEGDEESLRECERLRSWQAEWGVFLAKIIPELKNLTTEKRLSAIARDPSMTEQQKVQERYALIRASQREVPPHAREGRYGFERGYDRSSAFLIGKEGVVLRSFGREGLSPEAYLTKFERVVTTPDLFYTYEELFLDPTQPALANAPTGNLLRSIRLWGKEVCGIADMEREIQTKHGARVETENYDAGSSNRATHFSIRALRDHMHMVKQRLDFYPPDFVRSMRLRNVFLFSNLKRYHQNAWHGISGWGGDGASIAMNDDAPTFDHELFHHISYFRNEDQLDQAWARAAHGEHYENVYGSSGIDAIARGVACGGRPQGFADRYGLAGGIAEDRAMVAEKLLSSPRACREILFWAKTERPLAIKVALMQAFYKQASGGLIDERFWADFTRSDQPGGTAIDQTYWQRKKAQHKAA
ncbi:MAG: hypothetical protein V1926_05065 [Candidatus Peregrinibacteria bacterium]